MQEIWVPSLGQEGSLEKEMAPHSGILAWKIPWREEPGRLSSIGSQKSWGIKPRSPTLQEDSLPAEPPGKHQDYIYWVETNNLMLKKYSNVSKSYCCLNINRALRLP